MALLLALALLAPLAAAQNLQVGLAVPAQCASVNATEMTECLQSELESWAARCDAATRDGRDRAIFDAEHGFGKGCTEGCTAQNAATAAPPAITTESTMYILGTHTSTAATAADADILVAAAATAATAESWAARRDAATRDDMVMSFFFLLNFGLENQFLPSPERGHRVRGVV